MQAATIRPNAYSLIANCSIPGVPDHHDKPSPRAARHDSAYGNAIRCTFIARANRPMVVAQAKDELGPDGKPKPRPAPPAAAPRPAAPPPPAAAPPPPRPAAPSAATASAAPGSTAPAAASRGSATAPACPAATATACARSTAAASGCRTTSAAEARDASAAASRCAYRAPTAAQRSTAPGAAEAAGCAQRRAWHPSRRARHPFRRRPRDQATAPPPAAAPVAPPAQTTPAPPPAATPGAGTPPPGGRPPGAPPAAGAAASSNSSGCAPRGRWNGHAGPRPRRVPARLRAVLRRPNALRADLRPLHRHSGWTCARCHSDSSRNTGCTVAPGPTAAPTPGGQTACRPAHRSSVVRRQRWQRRFRPRRRRPRP